MWLALVAWAALTALLAGALLIGSRARLGRTATADLAGTPLRSADVAAALLAPLTTLAAAVALIFGTGLLMSAHWPRLPLLVAAVWLGASMALLHGVLAAAVPLYQWATHRTVDRVPPAFLARLAVVELLGLVAMGLVLVAAMHALAPLRFVGVALLYLLVGMVPLVDFVVKPWLVLGWAAAGKRSPVPPDGRAAELERWFGEMRAAVGLPGLRLVVLPGTVRNAFAVGVGRGGRGWIVVGQGLLEAFPEREIRAILLHELAHVLRRDVRKLLYVAIACAIGLRLVYVFTRRSLALWPALSTEAAVAIAGAISGLLLVLVTSWFSRRIEFGADRLAATMSDDPDALCSALQRLAQLHREPLDADSVTHPSVARRVAAIHALAR